LRRFCNWLIRFSFLLIVAILVSSNRSTWCWCRGFYLTWFGNLLNQNIDRIIFAFDTCANRNFLPFYQLITIRYFKRNWDILSYLALNLISSKNFASILIYEVISLCSILNFRSSFDFLESNYIGLTVVFR